MSVGNKVEPRGVYKKDLRDQQISYLLFCAGFCMWLFFSILASSNFNDAVSLHPFAVLSLLLIFLSELLEDWVNRKDWPLFIVALVMLLFSLFLDTSTFIFETLLIAFCSRRYDMHHLIKLSFWVSVLTVLLVVVSSLGGLIGDTYSYSGGRERRSFGFDWVTYLSHYYLNLCLAYVYTKKGNVSYISLIIMMSLNIAIFAYTDARNSFVLVILVIVMILVYKLKRGCWKPSGVTKALLSYSFLLCFLASCIIYLAFDSRSEIGMFLDSLLSSRVSLTQLSFDYYPVQWFGTQITWTNSELYRASGGTLAVMYVDCSYMNLLINYGIVATAIMLFLLNRITVTSIKNKDYLLGLILLIFALHSIVDPQLLSLKYCSFLLFLCRPENFGIFSYAPSAQMRKFSRKETRTFMNQENDFENPSMFKR